jgi:hypothetical protein
VFGARRQRTSRRSNAFGPRRDAIDTEALDTNQYGDCPVIAGRFFVVNFL